MVLQWWLLDQDVDFWRVQPCLFQHLPIICTQLLLTWKLKYYFNISVYCSIGILWTQFLWLFIRDMLTHFVGGLYGCRNKQLYLVFSSVYSTVYQRPPEITVYASSLAPPVHQLSQLFSSSISPHAYTQLNACEAVTWNSKQMYRPWD